jgi:hypothetical protein
VPRCAVALGICWVTTSEVASSAADVARLLVDPTVSSDGAVAFPVATPHCEQNVAPRSAVPHLVPKTCTSVITAVIDNISFINKSGEREISPSTPEPARKSEIALRLPPDV